VPGDEAYTFRHLLIRDAAYEALSKATRAELHERFADWLEGIAGSRLAEQEEIVGFHLERAHHLRIELGPEDDRTRSLAERGGERLAGSAHRAAGRGDVAAGAELYERAVDLLPDDHPSVTETLLGLVGARFGMGETDGLRELVERAIASARHTGDPVEMADASLMEMGLRSLMTPHDVPPEERRDNCLRAIETFESAGFAEGLSYANITLSDVAWTLGDASQQVAAAEQAIEICRRSGMDLDFRVVTHLCEGLFRGPIPCAEALRRTEAVMNRSQDHLVAWANARAYAGLFQALLGRSEEGRQSLAEARDVFEDMANPWALTAVVALQGMVEWMAGAWEDAQRDIRVEFNYHVDAGDLANSVMLGCDLARPLLDLDRLDEVLELTSEIATNATSFDIQTQCEWRARRGVALSRRGRVDEAVALIAEAEELARKTDFRSMLADTMYAKAEVFEAARRLPEAVVAAEGALTLFQRKGYVPLAARSRALLDRLGG
jgi:tetratricopeptide (TPR) repeat protein